MEYGFRRFDHILRIESYENITDLVISILFDKGFQIEELED
jgi:hypothetical protein